MDIQVKNCKDCIFNTIGRDDTLYCKLDDDMRDLITDESGYYATEEIPKWCPLIGEGVTIKFKK